MAVDPFALLSNRLSRLGTRVRRRLSKQESDSDENSRNPSTASSPDDLELGHPRTEKKKRPSLTTRELSSNNPVAARGRPSRPANRLMALPPELQLLIIRRLPFGDVERLRRTCRFYRSFITPKTVRELLAPRGGSGPSLKTVLLGHCYQCLRHDPARTQLLWADWSDWRYPLASKCVDCAVQDGELGVGRKIALGNFASVFVCRWCGYPVLGDMAAWNQPEYHRRCYRKYNKATLGYFVLGFVQFFIVVIGGTLLWRYQRQNRTVLITSIVNFLVALLCLLVLTLRGIRTRTYHWTLFFELAILGLWIPAVYEIAQQIQADPAVGALRSTQATLAFCGLNMLFRLLNAVGNVLLVCEFKFWRQNRPRVGFFKKIGNALASGFIFWTYPQSLDQEYPGMYCF